MHAGFFLTENRSLGAAHVSISALHGVKIVVQQISEMIFQKCIYALSLSVPLQPVKSFAICPLFILEGFTLDLGL